MSINVFSRLSMFLWGEDIFRKIVVKIKKLIVYMGVVSIGVFGGLLMVIVMLLFNSRVGG